MLKFLKLVRLSVDSLKLLFRFVFRLFRFALCSREVDAVRLEPFRLFSSGLLRLTKSFSWSAAVSLLIEVSFDPAARSPVGCCSFWRLVFGSSTLIRSSESLVTVRLTNSFVGVWLTELSAETDCSAGTNSHSEPSVLSLLLSLFWLLVDAAARRGLVFWLGFWLVVLLAFRLLLLLLVDELLSREFTVSSNDPPDGPGWLLFWFEALRPKCWMIKSTRSDFSCSKIREVRD